MNGFSDTRAMWLDLHVQNDPHPRRFDSLDTLRTYLRRVERLSPEAISELSQTGVVAPPLARLVYRVERPYQ
ncbi:hypothetical protein [Deinococcus aquiradiocola]|uniref:Uncharacterized protein n=1 Tax=Deinococcus aquiradiocola TaxID=393059 RepID=A0A917UIC4_9DEIO|nr:hypothetical protein [Deinococcus aquiradiocola]GGJ60623.1 hypothetical protein GCM10008939_00410 [Deinococcus aquiradiocola]